MNAARCLTRFMLPLFMLAALSPAEARWFERKPKQTDPETAKVKALQTYQPPPVNALEVNCEPYRREAVELSQKPWYAKPFSAPRRAWLIREHRKCRHKIMDQENLYLHHVDIEQPPQLPKLKMDAPGSATPASGTPGNGAKDVQQP